MDNNFDTNNRSIEDACFSWIDYYCCPKETFLWQKVLVEVDGWLMVVEALLKRSLSAWYWGVRGEKSEKESKRKTVDFFPREFQFYSNQNQRFCANISFYFYFSSSLFYYFLFPKVILHPNWGFLKSHTFFSFFFTIFQGPNRAYDK